jgi:hypothetical protein
VNLINIGDCVRIKKPRHQIDNEQWVEYHMKDKKTVGVFIFVGIEPIDAPGDLDVAKVLNAMGWVRVEDIKVRAEFETESEGLTGSTDAPVKRTEIQDDSSITVVIDHWPQRETPNAV